MIVSIPHSGTRFVRAFFAALGVDMPFRHYPQPRLGPVIVPVRNPAENMIGHWLRGQRDHAAFMTLASWWRDLLSWETVCFVPVDADPSRRFDVLTAAARFAGIAADEAVVRAYAEAWAPVGASNGPREITPEISAALGMMRDLWPRFEALGYRRFAWLDA